MTSAVRYPLVPFYDASSPECLAKVAPLRNRDTAGAAWAGEVSL